MVLLQICWVTYKRLFKRISPVSFLYLAIQKFKIKHGLTFMACTVFLSDSVVVEPFSDSNSILQISSAAKTSPSMPAILLTAPPFSRRSLPLSSPAWIILRPLLRQEDQNSIVMFFKNVCIMYDF